MNALFQMDVVGGTPANVVFGEQNGRLIAQDRQQTQHSHDLAEITALLTQLNRQLTELDQRLTALESQSADK